MACPMFSQTNSCLDISLCSFILKTIFGVIGIQVFIQEDRRKDKNAKVIVSNHVSNLDHMIIDFIIANITVSFHYFINSLYDEVNQ